MLVGSTPTDIFIKYSTYSFTGKLLNSLMAYTSSSLPRLLTVSLAALQGHVTTQYLTISIS